MNGTSQPNEQSIEGRYDCLVLSGGGAKGAYGAGVAKAIETYRNHKGIDDPICYIGASAGALNAYMLASGDADELIRFWLKLSNARVLGVSTPRSRLHAIWQVAKGSFSSQPRSLFGNRALEKLIRERASLERLHSPLIIAATDYTRGRMRAFYRSDLIDEFVAADSAVEIRARRLDHFRRIESEEALIRVLLASAAIPTIFPPVHLELTHGGKAESGWFIDGGVGNNTPTREAAYFLRFLNSRGSDNVGSVYCVKQERPRTVQDESDRFGFADIVMRTLDVYHYVHYRPIIGAWHRINREVQEQTQALARIDEWLSGLPLPGTVGQEISDRVRQEFGSPGGQAPRLDMPLLIIEPSIELGDTLNFDPARARIEIAHGYGDTLKMLSQYVDPRNPTPAPAIDQAEYDHLVNREIFESPA